MARQELTVNGLKLYQDQDGIEHNLDAFKKMVLVKASRVPAQWEDAEIRQWVMDIAKDAWVAKMPPSQMRRYQMAKQVYGL